MITNDKLIDNLIDKKQFECLQKEKEEKLLVILKSQIQENKINENLNSMYKKLGIDVDSIKSLKEIPYRGTATIHVK